MMDINKCSLYASHAWYVPGVKAMFTLFGWFLVGTLLCGIGQAILDRFTPQNVQQYEVLLFDPLTFLPAFIYVSRKSCRNRQTETGYKPNSNHFCPFKGWQLAFITVLLSLAYRMASDPIVEWYFKCTMLVPGMQSLFNFLVEVMEKVTIGPLWVVFITTSIYAAIFEEWLCRGILLRGLLAKMNPVWAIVISALFFSFIHMNPWQGLNTFLLGLLLGYVYYKTGSLWLTMLLHFVNNGTAIVLTMIPSLQSSESIKDIMSLTTYVVTVVVSIVILLVCIQAFRRIPLEQKRGNIDEV